jgi:DNA-binding transcriptional ArsR family regulator
MEDIPEIYHVETLEQLRAIADELRMRILALLTNEPRTVTEVARLIKEAPGKIHYHVRELERLHIVKLVETREKGGILEKYYRAVAKSIMVPSELLQSMPQDDAVATISDLFQRALQGFIRAMRYLMQHPEEPDKTIEFSMDHYWMTPEEYAAVRKKIKVLLDPYQAPREVADERERTMVTMFYHTPPTYQDDAAAAPLPSSKPRPVFVGGALHYSRQELENVVAAGETLDITVMGYCGFAKDIPAALVDQAIAHFRCVGKLDASHEVRAVLKRKGSDPTPESPALS